MNESVRWLRAARGLRLFVAALAAWLLVGAIGLGLLGSAGEWRSANTGRLALLAATALVNGAMLVGLVRFSGQPTRFARVAAIAACAILGAALAIHAYAIHQELLGIVAGGEAARNAWSAHGLGIVTASASVVAALSSIARVPGARPLAFRVRLAQVMLVAFWIGIIGVERMIDAPSEARYAWITLVVYGMGGLFGGLLFLNVFAVARNASKQLDRVLSPHDVPAARAVEN